MSVSRIASDKVGGPSTPRAEGKHQAAASEGDEQDEDDSRPLNKSPVGEDGDGGGGGVDRGVAAGDADATATAPAVVVTAAAEVVGRSEDIAGSRRQEGGEI